MSGGVAYIYNPKDTLRLMCNLSMVDLDPMDIEAKKELHRFVSNHAEFTGSKVANNILNDWDKQVQHFVKVMPKEIKLVLAKIYKQTKEPSKAN
jgi:glutamate synthase domain-containing protein 3